MATTVQSLAIKSVEDIRADFLRSYANALRNRGIPNPDVSEGTEIYNRALALAQQVYGASLAVPLAADAQMADSAQGDDLVRIAKPYGLGLRPAQGSAGPLSFTATVSTPLGIPQGTQLIDPAGLLYQVAVGGLYTAGGAAVPLTSVATGAATNLDAGTVLRWVAPPAFCNPTATVGAGGLSGGKDADTYEDLRARLLERLGNPPNGDNWPSLVADAEEASAAVQKAFAYQGCNGPSTEHVAVAGAPTATNKSRMVDTLVTLPTVITPAVLAARPLYVETVVTTVQDYPIDLGIGLALPASQLASPQGPGGGWTDGVPFPQVDPSSLPAFLVCDVLAVTSSTQFQVRTNVLPSVGSQICWVSRDDWQLRTAKVTTVVATTGSAPEFHVTIIIDTPFVSATAAPVAVAVGDYIFPNATNMATYVAAWLNGFSTMGPYEKTNAAGLLPRALRRPLATSSWPSALLPPFLRNFTAAAEVGDAQYLFKGQGNLALPSATSITVFGKTYIAPPLPVSIDDGPFIATPNRIGFYPI